MVTDRQINNVVNKIVEKVKPNKVILFGSYAYGQPTDDSDVDILVYTEDEVNEWKDVKASFIHEIIEKGKIFYNF